MLPKDFQKKLDKRIMRAASRGFTCGYQNKREHDVNLICLKQLALVTLKRYEDTVIN
jgi:hypothetical protein